MTIKFGPGTTISGFQHPGGQGGGGGGGGGLTAPTTAAVDPFGGSGPSWSFNGTTSGASALVNNNSLNPSGQDWCVEGFFYQTDSNPFPRVFSIGSYPTTAIAISLEGGTMYYWLNSGVAATATKPSTLYWHHFAFSRISGQTTMYLDGTLVASVTTDMPDIAGQTLYIGVETATPGATNFGGFINSFRWTVGNGIYTGTFTPPTAALGWTGSAGTNINEVTSGQVKLLY